MDLLPWKLRNLTDKPLYNEYRELISQICIICFDALADDSILENGYSM